MLIYPTLLAGGLGTRLWPAPRKSYAKQFSNLIGDESLFQKSARRLTSSDILEFAPHITLTNADFRFIIAEQLQAVGNDPGPILIEPEVKNTAAAYKPYKTHFKFLKPESKRTPPGPIAGNSEQNPTQWN